MFHGLPQGPRLHFRKVSMIIDHNLRSFYSAGKAKNQHPPIWKFCVRCSFGKMLLWKDAPGKMPLWHDAPGRMLQFPNRGKKTSKWGEVLEKYGSQLSPSAEAWCEALIYCQSNQMADDHKNLLLVG